MNCAALGCAFIVAAPRRRYCSDACGNRARVRRHAQHPREVVAVRVTITTPIETSVVEIGGRTYDVIDLSSSAPLYVDPEVRECIIDDRRRFRSSARARRRSC